jgi:acyl-coenzyme A synthetase/AMP-(fatty) acid ligase
VIFEGKEWTYKQIYDGVVRVGNWLMSELGVKEGEVVALNGGNSVEYMLCWFAIEGIGAIPSFVNCNLSGKSLMHCVQVRVFCGIWE